MSHLGAVILAALAALPACADGPTMYGPVDPEPRANAAWVTGAAAAALDADGRFAFDLPQLTAPFVPLAQARGQSEVFAHVVGGNSDLSRRVIEERGQHVPSFSLLVACARSYHVQNQFRLIEGSLPTRLDSATSAEPVPVPESVLRRFSDHWLIPLCNPEGAFEMTVEVSVAHNQLTFEPGQTTYPTAMTYAYYPRGVPHRSRTAMPITAEQAVGFAYASTGRKTAGVPALIHRGEIFNTYAILSPGSSRICSRWRLTLERPVLLRGTTSGREVFTSDVYVASRSCSGMDTIPEFHVPLPPQPSHATTFWQVFPEPGRPPVAGYSLPLRVIHPTGFEPAIVAR